MSFFTVHIQVRLCSLLTIVCSVPCKVIGEYLRTVTNPTPLPTFLVKETTKIDEEHKEV